MCGKQSELLSKTAIAFISLSAENVMFVGGGFSFVLETANTGIGTFFMRSVVACFSFSEPVSLSVSKILLPANNTATLLDVHHQHHAKNLDRSNSSRTLPNTKQSHLEE
jgi:hypothetical protein